MYGGRPTSVPYSARVRADAKRRRRNPLRVALHRLVDPVRQIPLPVLKGHGRGLRVRVGDAPVRVFSRGEPVVEEMFLSLLREGDVVCDIGANIGWYGLLAARKVGPRGKVFAFEPALLNAALAEKNARQNRLSNLIVVPEAITDQDGWLTFLDRGSLMSRLDKDDSAAQAERRARQGGRVKGETVVRVTTLDHWLVAADQPAPNVVKIDVEGAEAGVLRGMRQTLTVAKPQLIVELHGTRQEVVEVLESVGYEHAFIGHAGDVRGTPSQRHLIARPKPECQ